MEDESLKATAEKVIEQLTAVKEEFIKDKEELAVSIRRDVVKAELQDMLVSNADYSSLKNALEDYIRNLLVIEGE